MTNSYRLENYIMLFFKLAFFLILSVAIPFFFGYVAHALKSWTARVESEGQPADTQIQPAIDAEPAPETA